VLRSSQASCPRRRGHRFCDDPGRCATTHRGLRAGNWVGSVHGFDGAAWWRAPYDVEDCFTSVGLVALDDERYREPVAEFVQDAPGLTGPPDPTAVDALAGADGAVTPALVRAVIGHHGWDADAAAVAARRFGPN
jgi:hypothetical protein